MNMNRRFYCAVGVASGVFLLGGGVAEAAATAHEADRNIDPKATRVLPTDIFTATGGQHRLAASIGTLVERADNRTPGHGEAEIQPITESLSNKGMSGAETSPGSHLTNNAGAGRTELLPGLGGARLGGTDLLGGLLGGLPVGNLLGQLTGEGSPLGQLLGGGPLGALAGLTKGPTDAGNPSGEVAANSPTGHDSAGRGDDTAWRQARPGGDSPVGEAGNVTDPALGGAAANPAGRPATLNQPATYQVDGDAAARGNAVQEAPVPRPYNSGDGPVESQSVAGGNPLVDGMFGPDGPIGPMEILGGDTLADLPVVGDLLGRGLSLDTISNIPAIGDAMNQLWTQDAGKTAPALGNLRRSVTRAEQPLAPYGATAESSLGHVAEHRELARQATDKAKVAPELLTMFGPDTLGIQALSGIIQQLPPAG